MRTEVLVHDPSPRFRDTTMTYAVTRIDRKSVLEQTLELESGRC